MNLLPVFILFSSGLLIQSKSPLFEAQTIDNNVSIGYGLAIGDVDGDKKPDILLADKKEFVWYRNGDWKRFVMVENLTEGDNVCIAARDIDGDGKVEVAVGAQWVPSETADTLKSGSVHYLIRPKDPTQLWTPVKLHHEPTVHRMKWIKTSNNYQLVVVPLHGRGNKNGEGAGVKIISYEMGNDPRKPWRYRIVDQSMHMTHNFDVSPFDPANETIHIAGKEGIKTFRFINNKWKEYEAQSRIGGTSFGEVRVAHGFVACITPMHGNELGIYDNVANIVLTKDLNQGHALATGDLLASGRDQIIVGWREPNSEKKVGIKMFALDEGSTVPVWKEYWIDDNAMACEDLQLADLNGDNKKDVIASGRSTHNLKIYWNKN
jgi:hypothetical protein